MYKKTVSLLSGLLLFLSANSQDFNNYKPIQSSGKVPPSFLISSTEKYRNDLDKHITSKDKNLEKKVKKEFLLESNFQIDELLLSGKVLFNDPVGIYTNRVLDLLLKDEPELRKQLEVYVVKSSVVNAMTTNNGIIFVNLGLLAQLENEAQLAYILAHEVIHFKNKHVITGYLESEKIKKGAGIYRKTSLDNRLLARSRYSKELETEADLEGLDLYLKSGYSLETLDGVFDVLQYGYLPFDDIKFEKSFFETQHLILPETYFLNETAAIEPEDENFDSLATHPAVAKRRAAIAQKIENESNKKRKEFIIGREEFIKAQKTARFEVTGLYLRQRRYEAALYNSFMLLQNEPESIYLKKSLLKSLYGLTKYANADRYEEVHHGYKRIQGQSQQVYHFFDKMQPKELNVLALSYAWRIKKQYPEDEEINEMTNQLFTELAFTHFPERTFFASKPKEKPQDESADKNVNDPEEDDNKEKDEEEENNKSGKKSKKVNTKYDKIKKKKEEEGTTDYFLKYALVEQMQDPEFVAMYDAKIKERVKWEEEKTWKESREYRAEQRKINETNKRKGFALGIQKMVFVSPFYVKIDETKRNAHQLVASEGAQKAFDERIAENAKLSGIDFALLDKKDLSENGASAFNDISYLTDWISEKYDHEDLNFVNYKEEYAQSLVKKYGTQYFCWMGVISVRKRNENAAINICGGILLPPLLPFIIYQNLQPKYETYFYSVIIDLKTGKKVYSQINQYNFSDRDDILNVNLYDMFQQFRNKRKSNA